MTYWTNDLVACADDGWSGPVRADERHPQTPSAPRTEIDPDDYDLVLVRAAATGNQQLLQTLEHAINRTATTAPERKFCQNQVRIAAASIRAEAAESELVEVPADQIEYRDDVFSELAVPLRDDDHFVDELAAIAWSAMCADETKSQFLARLRALLGVES